MIIVSDQVKFLLGRFVVGILEITVERNRYAVVRPAKNRLCVEMKIVFIRVPAIEYQSKIRLSGDR